MPILIRCCNDKGKRRYPTDYEGIIAEDAPF